MEKPYNYKILLLAMEYQKNVFWDGMLLENMALQ